MSEAKLSAERLTEIAQDVEDGLLINGSELLRHIAAQEAECDRLQAELVFLRKELSSLWASGERQEAEIQRLQHIIMAFREKPVIGANNRINP